MKNIIIFISSLISITLASDVVELSDSNFQSHMKDKYDGVALVEFFAPWCGHCKRLAPEYEIAATKLKKNDPVIPLIKVDCTEGGKDTCSKFGVSGYPTLKIFNDGKPTSDYEGPRDAGGIVSYMKKQAGPASKEYAELDALKKRLDDAEDPLVVGFFSSADDQLFKHFNKASQNKRMEFDFAHTFQKDIADHFEHSDSIVLFRPKMHHARFEDNKAILSDKEASVYNIEVFLEDNVFGLVGHMTPKNANKFHTPVIVAYYDVDWKRNAKGTNYWRNRVARVAKKHIGSLYFAIAAKSDYQNTISDWKLDHDVVVSAKSSKGDTYLMTEKFSVDGLTKFVEDFKEGKLKAYIKSEPIPDSNDGPVKVVVGETFKEIVEDPSKDVLIEFYAPWCGHCKTLEPKYNELGEKLKNVKDVVIAKIDATANDVPSNFAVQGFPTIYWAPMGNKESPKKYEGGRDVSDFISFIKREATNPADIPDEKKKKKKKSKKEEL